MHATRQMTFVLNTVCGLLARMHELFIEKQDSVFAMVGF